MLWSKTQFINLIAQLHCYLDMTCLTTVFHVLLILKYITTKVCIQGCPLSHYRIFQTGPKCSCQITGINRYGHMFPDMACLHWLPVVFHAQFKLLLPIRPPMVQDHWFPVWRGRHRAGPQGPKISFQLFNLSKFLLSNLSTFAFYIFLLGEHLHHWLAPEQLSKDCPLTLLSKCFYQRALVKQQLQPITA